MGIFESNYTRIAKKTAKYYFELKKNYAERFDNEISILATAGLLDAVAYVVIEQSIVVTTLLDVAKRSLKNALDIKSRKNIGLINFIYWLEVEIFSIDTRLRLYEIQETVMGQLNKIEKAVLKTQEEYKEDSKIKLNARKFMLGDEGISYRRALGIKEI